MPGTLDPAAADGTLPPGRIPRDPDVLRHLLGAFSGGYQAVNGQFGQIVDRRVFVPVQPWAASIVRFDDGSLGFGSWPPDLEEPPFGVASVRQNLSPLVEDGVFNPYGRKAWGGLAPTVPSHGLDEDVVPTVRSALCATTNGLAAHLWARSVTVRTLAAACERARCPYAAPLDMNPDNAIVELYRVGAAATIRALPPPGEGETRGSLETDGLWYRAHLVLPEMADDAGRFLFGSERDFIYLVLRDEPLPEAPPAQPDTWKDAANAERPLFASGRFAVRRVFPDVTPVRPTTWWPAQRDTLPRDYIQRIRRIWAQKGGSLRP